MDGPVICRVEYMTRMVIELRHAMCIQQPVLAIQSLVKALRATTGTPDDVMCIRHRTVKVSCPATAGTTCAAATVTPMNAGCRMHRLES